MVTTVLHFRIIGPTHIDKVYYMSRGVYGDCSDKGENKVNQDI